VFGEASARDAQDVLAKWDAIKRGEAGRDTSLFGEVPENLPALLHARKLQRRAAEKKNYPRRNQSGLSAV